ncbi:3-hydroxyacyl-CoA dehydrogenase [Mangrovimicrobium sediminis]|uniref:3-hydroxyacyl-CoA dehydrogenase n=1 Tax=Mangrovimicrobium sediminis TaxID=2562682 RepID=A0A4Z0M4S7_9GAMM|nr:3-hydroxyacyl-CoA dehydrogenase NAD-binding domain-containing protein [Haliea sp. SAOS-164]TGD74305.1 3-hydroxyacyl-CoA dehydrogenase [Haliea sp. SAOS-164]
MATHVHYTLRENTALIRIDNPPVNGLGQAVRAGLQAAFRQAAADPAVETIVLASATGSFSAGADITEFASGGFDAEPELPGLLTEIEESDKLVVAAIDGVALGGGLELALAADYRIAAPGARVGLPEVQLGLIPGAGGTQRLPRLTGAEAALDMITSGKPIDAERGLALGCVDRLCGAEEPLLDAAIAYARDLHRHQAPLRSCAQMSVDMQSLPEDFFAATRSRIAARQRGFLAPLACVDAVEAACTLPLDQGLARERELFARCLASPQARAQQHLFFAERAAARVPGVPRDTAAREVRKVAVIGAGTMGGGIAMNFLNGGIPTVLLDLGEESLQRGVEIIGKNYAISASKGRISDVDVRARLALLQPTTDYADLADADLVIEAVFERMDIKQAVFRQLDAVCKPGAILASNTSTLDVDAIAAATARPGDVIGMHFFSPANVMRLLEVVRGRDSAADAIVTAQKIARRIGKLPVVVGVCFGFVGNRMLEPYGREAMRLVLEGASPAQVDGVLTGFGLAMGLCAMSDLAGIDVGYLTREGNRAAIAHDPGYAIVADRLYQAGHYGQKTGCGFYRYEGRERSENPEVENIAVAAATALGIARREISDEEILERCLYPLINEGAQILDEGIAARASDCDLVYVNGYGFPAWRGGPMQWADEIGLDKVLAGMQRYREQLGEYGETWFRPAPLLQRLAQAGERFADFDARNA